MKHCLIIILLLSIVSLQRMNSFTDLYNQIKNGSDNCLANSVDKYFKGELDKQKRKTKIRRKRKLIKEKPKKKRKLRTVLRKKRRKHRVSTPQRKAMIPGAGGGGGTVVVAPNQGSGIANAQIVVNSLGTPASQPYANGEAIPAYNPADADPKLIVTRIKMPGNTRILNDTLNLI